MFCSNRVLTNPSEYFSATGFDEILLFYGQSIWRGILCVKRIGHRIAS
jgi:hypothetical protein